MRLFLFLALALDAASCTSSCASSSSSAPSDSSSPSAPKPADSSAESEVPPKPVAGAEGTPCTSAADCASGVCEGEGCGSNEGRCAPEDRMCTRDLQAYCGCDGETFRASGSCPGRRFEHRGACEGDASLPMATGKKPAGDSCLTADECASGICEGEGCDDSSPGTCVNAKRPCTRDLVAYCSCDGETFQGSGSCPGRRYAGRGPCQP